MAKKNKYKRLLIKIMSNFLPNETANDNLLELKEEYKNIFNKRYEPIGNDDNLWYF